jgi:hypothetical protein
MTEGENVICVCQGQSNISYNKIYKILLCMLDIQGNEVLLVEDDGNQISCYRKNVFKTLNDSRKDKLDIMNQL